MKLPSIAEIMQGTNEIFNPYCKKSYEKPSNSHAKHDYIISERRLNSVGAIQAPSSNSSGESVNNLDDKSKSKKINHNIYVFKIRATTAAVQVMFEDSHGTEQQVQEANFRDDTEKEQTGSWLAFTYFDKGIEEMLLEDSTDTSDNKNESNGANYQYFCHYLGQITNNDYDNLSRWQEVPREFFSSVNDYVYLLIVCKDITPYLQIYNFPFEKPFFWDLPVATSIYSGHTLSDSKILLGNVMILVSRRRNIEEAPNGLLQLAGHTIDHIVSEGIVAVPRSINYIYSSLKGHYKWVKDSNICTCENNDICTVKHPEIRYVYGEKEYICSNVELDLYVYEENRNGKGNDITAFVWRSGSEDDLVKKSYLSDTHSEEPAKLYNQYSYILDSLSLGAIYRSFASLTKITPKNVARYAVRHLTRQPIGNRSLSIEGHLLYIIGGALYRIKKILDEYKGEREDGNTQSKKGLEKLTCEDFLRVQTLFRINNSHIFFDSDVTYKNLENIIVPPQLKLKVAEEERYYMEKVLGIEEGSNGCKRIEAILESIISTIKKEGLEIDYVYCDIENIFNDARMLRVNRFSSKYIKLLDELEGDTCSLDKIYQQILSEIKNHPDIMPSLKSLGYYFTEDSLKDIESVPVGENGDKQMYGIANSKSYAQRRNVNVWDVVMKNYTNRLFHDYIYLPVHDAFPNAVFSADSRFYSKGYLNRAELFETYLGGSLKLYGDMYSSIPLYGDHMTKGYKKLNMDNWKILPEPTLFSFFMDHINRLRAVALSSPQNHFNVFIPSWNLWAYDINKILEFKVYDNEGNITKHDEIDEEKAVEYHRELLYHAFLMNPDKAIAYFSLDSSIEDKTHYINLEEEKEEGYFKFAYDELQKVLKDLNGELGAGTIIPKTNTLAVETEPYVLSCAEENNKWHWRLTVNEEIEPDNDMLQDGTTAVIFHMGERILIFNDVVKYTKERGVGFWIVTPIGVEPQISSIVSKESYYYEYPAYISESKQDEHYPSNGKCLIMDGKMLKFNAYSAYTLFGKLPQHQCMSVKFRLTGEIDGEIKLLWSNAFIHDPELLNKNISERNKQCFHAAIGGKSQDGKSIPFEILGKGIMNTENSTAKIVLNEQYELRLVIDIIENNTNDYLRANAEYRLYKDTECVACASSPIIIDNSDYKQNLMSTLAVCYLSEEKVWENLYINDFRLYFSDHQERLEIFRESDGMNISNIIETDTNTKNDTLIGKFSWLNAEDKSLTYRLDLTVDKDSRDIKTYDDTADIITCPFDERIDILSASDQFVEFSVVPNSEGYMLVKFPKFSDEVKLVQWELKAKHQSTESWQTIGFVDAGTNKKE